MKIVIDIDDEYFEQIKNHTEGTTAESEAVNAIRNGTPYEEKPKGEWIMQRHDLDGCFYTCSNCGRMIRIPLFIDDPEDNETLTDYPFCHCGADMRKENEA